MVLDSPDRLQCGGFGAGSDPRVGLMTPWRGSVLFVLPWSVAVVESVQRAGAWNVAPSFRFACRPVRLRRRRLETTARQVQLLERPPAARAWPSGCRTSGCAGPEGDRSAAGWRPPFPAARLC